MANNPNRFPFMGIVALGSSMKEAASAYRNVVLGKNAHAVTDAAGSFLFISNQDLEELNLSNPLTGEQDMKAVPKALSAVTFRTESSGKVPVRYSVCAHENGNGCGTHLMYDSKDLMNFCPICNEPIVERSESELQKVLSMAGISQEDDDSVTSEDSDVDDDDVSIDDIKAESSDDPEDEDLSFNDISDDEDEDDEDEDEEDYESESSDDEALSDDSGLNFEEMSDDELAAFEGESSEPLKSNISFKGNRDTLRSISNTQDKNNIKDDEFSLSEHDIEEIRRDLEREVRTVEEQARTKSVSSAKPAQNTPKLTNFVVASRSQTKAVEKFKAVVLGTSKLTALSSTKDDGLLTLAADADAFKYSPFTGKTTAKTLPIKQEANKQVTDLVLKSLSSNEDYSFDVADLFQCESSDCGVFVLSSSENVEFCPLCASNLTSPEELEEDIVPTEEDESADADGNVAEASADNQANSTDEDSDVEDFDIEDFLSENSAAEIAEDLSMKAKPSKKLSSTSSDENEDGTDGEDDAAAAEVDDAEYEKYEAIEASEDGVKAERHAVTLTLLSHAVSDTDNTNYKQLSVIYCGDMAYADQTSDATWAAFYKGQPVAYATLASAIKHKDIFNEPVFATATVAAAKENGIRKALTDMGFKPYNVKLKVKDNIAKLVASEVKSALALAASEAQTKLKEYDDRLISALSTASMGINRGFFKNLNNPVKAALWNSLSAAGVRNPEVMIDNVFAAQADSYHKTLFEKAKDIVNKPVEIQNELAAAVIDSNYISTSGNSETYPGSSAEDRLSSMGRTVTTPTQSNSMTSTSGESSGENTLNKRIVNIVSTLGRR